ncbi:MAG: hypothetical protein IJU52_05260 [Clostridia bacterium]|nr:hypothetical protein [Clostridia bacterium]
MRYMIVDVGSNTVKYDVFSVSGNKKLKKEGHGTRPVRLLARIKDGVLTPEGMDLLCDTLSAYRKEAQEKNCGRFEVFATAGVRKIADPAAALDEVKTRTGIGVRLLSGEEEAACSFRGMLLTLKKPPRRGMMLDMGGGSTEFNFFEEKTSKWLCSRPFGVVSVRLALGLKHTLTKDDKARVTEYVRAYLPEKAFEFSRCAENAVLIGGTAKAISRLAGLFLGVRDEKKLSGEEFFALRDFLCTVSDEQYELIKQLCPDRHELMAAGTTAFSAIFEALGTKKVYICSGGIREGYLSLLEDNG